MLRSDVCYSVTLLQHNTQLVIPVIYLTLRLVTLTGYFTYFRLWSVHCDLCQLSTVGSYQRRQKCFLRYRERFRNPQSKFYFQKFQIFLIWNSGIRLEVNNTNMGKTIGYFWWLRLIVIIKIYIIVQVKLNSIRVDQMFVLSEEFLYWTLQGKISASKRPKSISIFI